MPLAYGIGGLISVPQGAILGDGPPPANLRGELGQLFIDKSQNPRVVWIFNGATWQEGGNGMATTTEPGIVELDDDLSDGAEPDTVPTSVAAKAYIDGIAIAGSPDADQVTKGISFLATNADVVSPYATPLGANTVITPANITTMFASPPAIGGATPGSGTFTGLSTDGTGAVSLQSNAAALFDVTGVGDDLTLSSDSGRVIVNGEEAVANAITLVSAAGGIDVDAALQININTTQNAADSIVIRSAVGGIDILAAGAGAAEDIDIIATGSSVNISSTENTADAITLSAANGGIDITCGGGAGEDIDLVNTAGSININAGEAVADAINIDSAGGMDVDVAGQINLTSSQNAASAIAILASAGGIDITATGSAGEDVDITATGSSVNVTATEDAALAIWLHANGGTSETIQVRADQGTGVASVELVSDVGGVTIQGGLATADAVNIVSSNAAGGIDIDGGTAGVAIDSTGAVSIDGAASSNFAVSGAGIDLTLDSAAGQLILTGGEAAANAVRIQADNVAGGIDIDAGTAGIAIDTSGALSLDSAGNSNFTVTGAFDLTLSSTAGSINITAAEAAADAVVISASDAAGGITLDAGSAGVNVTGANLALATAGTHFSIEGGAVTDFIGEATLAAGTVTVANTNIAANDLIYISRRSINGSTALGMLTYSIVAATSFTITSVDPTTPANTETNDVSIVSYLIVRML